jgi:hypothetical protein
MPKGIYDRKNNHTNKGKLSPLVSEALKGNKYSLGCHPSEETKLKMRRAHWKGGRSMACKRLKSRRRGFDFIPLNSYHEGWDFHHWNESYGSYMPKEEHRGIGHSVLRDRNMNEINALAMNYLGG